MDRDNTVVKDDEGFINHPSIVKLLPGVVEAIKKLNKNSYKVIVATNQSGIGRNFFDDETLKEIHSHMVQILAQKNAIIDDVYYCPHMPDDNCTCRKPLPGMLVEASARHNIDLSKSYMVGDHERDIQAGKNAGCKTILLNNDPHVKTEADFVAENLIKAIVIILDSKFCL